MKLLYTKTLVFKNKCALKYIYIEKTRHIQMENYFFINPKAGQGKGIDKLAANIEAAAAALGMTAKIYITKGVGDGERKARETAQSLDGRPARFFTPAAAMEPTTRSSTGQ